MFDLSMTEWLAYGARFLIGSTAILGGVWLAEKLGVLRSPSMQEFAWKSAVAVSLLLLIPTSGWSTLTLPAPWLEPAQSADGTSAQPAATGAARAATTDDTAAAPPAPNVAPDAADLRPENLGHSNAAPTAPAGQSGIPTGTLAWAVIGLIAVLGVSLLLLLTSFGASIRALGSRRRVGQDERPAWLLRDICEQMGIRHVPYLSRSDTLKSPVCLPGREICLPGWAFDDLPEAQIRSLLAHETAHMRRGDPAMLIAINIICRALPVQPLFWLAKARLTDLAELSADAWAARATGNAHSVAQALYTCAQKINENTRGTTANWGLAMAGKPSILRRRMERLIHSPSELGTSVHWSTRTGLVLALVGCAAAAPDIAFERGFEVDSHSSVVNADHRGASGHSYAYSDGQHAPGDTAITISRSNDSGSLNYSAGKTRFKATWDGKFTVREDETGLASIEPGGFFRLWSEGSPKYVAEYGHGDGGAELTLSKNRSDASDDKRAQAWLAETFALMVRETGLDIPGRVDRLLKKGGPDLLLADIEGLHSDWVKRHYLTHMIQRANLSDAHVSKAIGVIDAFESDYETRLAFSALLEQTDLSSAQVDAVFKSAVTIDSDYELRLLLSPLIDRYGITSARGKQVLKAAETMDSDYEMRLLLSAAFHDTKLSADDAEHVLTLVADKIESDYEKRLLISSIAHALDDNPRATDMALKAAADLDSDYEKRLLLSAILHQGSFDEESWIVAIKAAASMGSDYEKRLALSQIQHDIPGLSENISRAFDAAVDTISSDYERRLLGRDHRKSTQHLKDKKDDLRDRARRTGQRQARVHVGDIKAVGSDLALVGPDGTVLTLGAPDAPPAPEPPKDPNER